MSRLLVRAVIAAALLVATAAPATAAPPTSSVTNTQVNAVFSGPFRTNKQNEPSLAMDPNNPAHFVAGSNDEIEEPPCTNATPSSCAFVPGVQTTGFYASFDGGATWPCQGVVDLGGQ